MKRFYLLAVMLLVFAGAARADVLWYNGDLDSRSGLSNERNTIVSDSRVYDDFNVPSGGWTLNTVWSNDLTENLQASTAYWEIRSGVSLGNGGSLLFSGTSPVTQTPTGRSAFGDTEYTFEVSGLNIPLSAGTYWLTVAPIDSGDGRSFISTTIGLNAVGTPPGNNDNSFWDSPFFGKSFVSTSDFAGLGDGTWDLSMGVSGKAGAQVPEPCTLALFGLSALGLLRRRAGKRA